MSENNSCQCREDSKPLRYDSSRYQIAKSKPPVSLNTYFNLIKYLLFKYSTRIFYFKKFAFFESVIDNLLSEAEKRYFIA